MCFCQAVGIKTSSYKNVNKTWKLPFKRNPSFTFTPLFIKLLKKNVALKEERIHSQRYYLSIPVSFQHRTGWVSIIPISGHLEKTVCSKSIQCLIITSEEGDGDFAMWIQ